MAPALTPVTAAPLVPAALVGAGLTSEALPADADRSARTRVADAAIQARIR